MAEWKKKQPATGAGDGQPAEAASAGNTSRRDVLKAAGAVVGSRLVAGRLAAGAAGVAATQAAAAGAQTAATASAKFLTPQEFSLADELTELILPADDHSPGARAAQCAQFIDQQLHGAVEDELRSQWRDGLAQIDALSQQMHGAGFLNASLEQRLAVVDRIARNEGDPQSAEERFFEDLKSRTVFAYYTSKVGIHDELEYKGNVYQEEFAGYDAETLQRD
jgi:gluconate 2-dehydrogenase gamma chain